MAYIVMAYIVMADLAGPLIWAKVMAYIVMAYVVMADLAGPVIGAEVVDKRVASRIQDLSSRIAGLKTDNKYPR